MPVPIRSVKDNGENKLNIDFSFLLNAPQPSKKTVVASNKDADLLFDIWTKGSRDGGSEIIMVDESMGVNKRDIMRLKSMGLISTRADGKVEFTKKGKRKFGYKI